MRCALKSAMLWGHRLLAATLVYTSLDVGPDGKHLTSNLFDTIELDGWADSCLCILLAASLRSCNDNP
jgi:hypothetical protein